MVVYSPFTFAILDAIAAGPAQGIHVDRLARDAGLNGASVHARLARLAGEGLVHGEPRWRLTAQGRAMHQAIQGRFGAASPTPRDSLRQRLWTGLRKTKKTTARDLATIAAEGDERDAHGTARRFLAALERAGYVAALPRRGANRPKTCVLVRDTGPRAPIVSADGTVSDPNTGEAHRV